MGQTHLGLQDWQSQVMLELLELSTATLMIYGVSLGPLATPRDEEGLEPMPGPSSQEIPDVPKPFFFGPPPSSYRGILGPAR